MLSWELVNQLINDPNIKSKLNGSDLNVLFQACFWADDNNIFKWNSTNMSKHTGISYRGVNYSRKRLLIDPITDSSGNSLSKEGFFEIISAKSLNNDAKYRILLTRNDSSYRNSSSHNREEVFPKNRNDSSYKPNKEPNNKLNKEINKEKLIEGMTWK